MLRMNDNSHEQFGALDARRDEGVCEDQPSRELVGRGTRRRLRTDRAGAESTAVPETEQRAKRDGEALPGQDHCIEPSPTGATDPAVDGYAADREKGRTASKFPPAVHGRRHRIAGRVGCGARGSLGSGGAASLPTNLGGVWRRDVPPSGRHLVLAQLQLAPVGCVPEDSRAHGTHPGEQGIHWGAPATGPKRTAGVSSCGHGTSGTTRRKAGSVSSQRGRYGDAVAGGGPQGG